MSDRRATIRLDKENMKFSAGHFTIFGPGSRERLHGHNFKVSAVIQARVAQHGLCFDYGIFKRKIVALCRELNEYVILPGESALLAIETQGEQLVAVFGEERIPFLKSDVLVLPIENTTVEEFARWFLQRLTADRAELDGYAIESIEVEVASGPGQGASLRWDASD